MQQTHTASKRVLTMILTVAILLSAFSSTLAFAVMALSGSTDAKKTDGQIIAENYDLTEKEKDLLKSGYLMGATHNYNIPDASDDLISVDIDKKIITAKSFKGADGYIWNPVSIDIIENNAVSETITAITDNKASYSTTATAFAVKVKYDVTYSIDEAIQALLLNASDVLKSGIDNLDAVLDPNGDVQLAIGSFIDLSTMAGSIPADSNNPNAATKGVLELLLEDGYKVGPVTLSLLDYIPAGADKEGIKYTEVDAVAALFTQINANGGKINLQVLADEYAAASSKVKFLNENADRIHKEIVKTFDYIYALTADTGTFAQIKNLADMPVFGVSSSVRTGIDAYIASIYKVVGNKIYDSIDNVAKADKEGVLDAYCSADAWKILSSNPIKDGLTDADYGTLDILVGALGDDIKGASASVKNPLVVDTTTIQYNMSMYDVTVKVTLKIVEDVVDSAALVNYDTVTVKLTLAQNATADEVATAIQNSLAEQNALNKWAGIYVDGCFDRAADVIPSTLTGDIEHNITYTPKIYDFTSNYGGDAKLPYGYKLYLPKHADVAQAYDYSVNGTYYAQGSVVAIMGDVDIVRTTGKSYTSYTINNIVANNFFAGDSTATAILTSGALNVALGNTVVNVRQPDDADGLVSLSGNTLTAKAYSSSYEGLNWMPYTYTIVNGSNSEVKYFGGATTATITSANYDRVDVVYRLTLNNIGSVQDLLDLPAILVGEAKSQIEALEKLNAYYDAMAEISGNKTLILSLNTFIEADEEASAETKEKLTAAVSGLTSECFNGNTLKMYALMTGYRAEGLAYYYENSASFHKEIETLDKYLAVISEEKEVLRRIAESVMAEAVDYVDKIDDIGGAIAQLKADLKLPNAAINLSSANLDKLVTALTSATSVSAATTKPLYIESKTFSVNAGDKITISASVAGFEAARYTFAKGHVLTAGDIELIIKAIEDKIDALNYSDKYYNSNYSKSVLTALIGKDVADPEITTVFAFSFTLKSFTVKIEGAADAVIDLENLKITLPASNSTAFRYDYEIFGKTVSADKYTFTADEFDKIVAAGGYTVKRTVVDVAKEEYVSLINNFNAAIGNDRIVFALTEKNGEYAVVMKLDLSDPAAISSAVMNLAMELASYGYVAFDDNAMIYTDASGVKVSIQALIDTVLESGFGTDTLLNMVNANGSINNMAMPGAVISDKNITSAGALLAQSELRVGNSESDLTHQVPMYVTVGAVQSSIVSVRNLFADYLRSYFSVKCVNGEIRVDMTLPQKAYEAYLAVLIVTDNIDITNINAINEQIAVGFLEDIIRPIMQSDASAKSVQNTLNKFGFDIDLTGYEEAFEALRDAYNNKLFVYDEEKSTYDAIVDINVDGYLDSLGAIGNMIVEKDTGIKIPISASLVNVDDDFEALYFDVKADGIMNKFGLVKDISAKLDSIAGTAVIILLDDIDGSLTFNTTTVLNLNGCVIGGDLVGKGSVNVIDSAIDADNVGGVNGKVSGNVTLAGGAYNYNVSAFIPAGYAQDENGQVANQFINIVRDADGNITALLNADVLAMRSLPEFKILAIDVVAELLLNGLSTNKLYFNGNKVYDLTVEDLIGIYTASSRTEALLQKVKSFVNLDDLINIINILLADITDFETMSAVLNADLANGTETPIASYDITTGAWGLAFDYVEDDDSITIDITSNHESTSSLDIVITGADSNKQYVANVMNLLADTTVADFKVAGGLSKQGSTIVANASFSANVQIDFSKDSKYAVLLSTIIADGIGSSANGALVAGLETFFKTYETAELEAAFNKLTINQIITAAKNFTRDKNLSGMLSNIGLGAYYDADAAKLEEDFDVVGVVIGKLFAKADVDGPATVIGGFLNADTNAYTFDKEDLSKTLTRDLFKGYDIEITVTVEEAFASIKLFDKGQPADTIDYSALEAEIAKIKAENLDKNKYTTDSWNAFSAVLAAAEALVGNAESQAEVDTMVDNLKAARAGLVEKVTPPPAVTIDYSVLLAEIAKIEAENLNADDYTYDSWTRFATILEMAKNIIGNAKSQVEVEIMIVQLRGARAGLVLKGVVVVIDYSALEAEIAKIEAENLDQSKYTDESWATFAAVLAMAKDLVGNATTQAQVDTMLTDLKAARAGLVEKVEPPIVIDYSALEAEIAKIEAECLTASKYTADSWEAFQATLTAAKNLIGNATTQAEVDAMVEQLKAARNGLVEKEIPPVVVTVDYTALKAAIARAEARICDEYTEESWDAMIRALEAARAALTSNDQAVVDKAAEDLNDAIDALKEKGAPAWALVALGSVGGLGIVAAIVTVIVRKKKKMTDSTPLVNYDIDEDNT